MEKTTLGLIAALGAAAAATGAQASAPATDRILNPTSIADLLEPVADPVATLDALQDGRRLEAVETPEMQVAETVIIRRHHHHHHHRYVVIRRHHHHHHHHFWRRHRY